MRPVLQSRNKKQTSDLTCKLPYPILNQASSLDLIRRNCLRYSIVLTWAVSTDGFPVSVRWTIIDIFFAITVASLPTLNCLFPMAWTTKSYWTTGRSYGRSVHSGPNAHKSDSSSKTKGSPPHELPFYVNQAVSTESHEPRSSDDELSDPAHLDWDSYSPDRKSPV